MTLLIVVFAAVISSLVWYTNEDARELKCGVLCYMFWGASLMWMVDAIAEYIELGADYFVPSIADMINDAFLGFSVVAFALVIWVVFILIKDPKSLIRNSVKSKN